MLERSDAHWWLAMFDLEVYFDDSGTDGGTPVAVAACYISSKEQWTHFVRNWDEVGRSEGFKIFHMCEFMAKPDAGHKPFCDWDNTKKDRVYAKLASVINIRIRHGFAVGVPKKPFDQYVFQEFKDGYAADHYTWAVRSLLGLISEWRDQYGLHRPMQYVFHHGSLSQGQIEKIWTTESKQKPALAEHRYGIVADGIMFQDDAVFKPLQAVDILAWQMQNHMRRTVMKGLPARTNVHPGFLTIWEDRPVDLLFYGTDQLKKVFDDAKAYKEKYGDWPWVLAPFRERARIGKAGAVY
jgi:hypothetical protein